MMMRSLNKFVGRVSLDYEKEGRNGVKSVLGMTRKSRKTFSQPQHPYTGYVRWQHKYKYSNIYIQANQQEAVHMIFHQQIVDVLRARLPGLQVKYSHMQISYPILIIEIPFPVKKQKLRKACPPIYSLHKDTRDFGHIFLPKQLHQSDSTVKYYRNDELWILNAHLITDKTTFLLRIYDFLFTLTYNKLKHWKEEEEEQPFDVEYQGHDLYLKVQES